MHINAKDQNESCYTSTIRGGKLHDLLSKHHRANVEGIHMAVGDVLQIEG